LTARGSLGSAFLAALRSPCDEHQRGVVVEWRSMVFEEDTDEATHRLGSGEAGGKAARQEVNEAFDPKKSPAGERASITPSV
jgi:hypothetical protein